MISASQLFVWSFLGTAFRASALSIALTVIFIGLFVHLASAQERPATDTIRVDVNSAIQRALEVSPEVGEVAADFHFAEARHRLARASRFLPEFQLTTAHAPAPGLTRSTFPTDRLYLDPEIRNDWSEIRPFNQVEVTFAQPIFTWGQLGGSIRAASHGSDVEAARVKDRERTVAVRTGELYYNLLLTEQLVRLAEETRGVLEQAEREINRLLLEGDERVEDAHLFRLQITEQEFRRSVVQVEENRRIARMALRRQLFLPDHLFVMAEEAVLEPLPFSPEPLDSYLTLALRSRPEIAQADAGLAAREALVEVARSDYYPKLFLAGQGRLAVTPGRYRQHNPYVGDPLQSRTLLAGVGFVQQLNFGQTRARVQQAEAQRNQVVHLRTAAEQLILFEVENAYRTLVIAQAALDAQQQALQISREWLRTEQINFDLELGDARNLVDAVQENLELQANYYIAVNQYNQAVLQLLNATGVLADRAAAGTFVE